MSLWVSPPKLVAENYSQCETYEYEGCRSSGFTTRDAVIVGVAAALGGIAGAVAGNGNKGSKGSHGSRGFTGDTGPAGATGAAGAAGVTGATGPAGPTGSAFSPETGPAQLSFIFHAGPQTTATGTLRGVVTLPDLSFQTIELPFLPSDNTATIVVGPPSIEGEYVLTIHIHELTGILSLAPSVVVLNSVNGEQSVYSAALPQAQGQQTNFSFVYDTFLFP